MEYAVEIGKRERQTFWVLRKMLRYSESGDCEAACVDLLRESVEDGRAARLQRLAGGELCALFSNQYDTATGKISYDIACEVTCGREVPEGYLAVDILPSRYAVYRVKLESGKDLLAVYKAVNRHFWGHWLPGNGERTRIDLEDRCGCAAIECPAPFGAQPACIEYWFPLCGE